MEAVLLSRLQFALATFFHFLYVPLTLGLAFFIAIMETRFYRTGDVLYRRQAKFWGRVFLINFALGVVTGLTLEFQFGTNWAGYSAFVGDIFGSLLAIEATAAFFLESTFIGVWAFGWKKLSPKAHLAAIWLVSLSGLLSALWILLANGFMQHPVGFRAEGDRLVLDSFLAVVTNPYGWSMYFHTLIGSMLVCGFLVLGVSAYHLSRRREEAFFQKSFSLGLCFCLCFSILACVSGHLQGQMTAKYQPAKLAAMEALWETQKGAPMHLWVVPPLGDEEENLSEALALPGLMSFMATNSFEGEVRGLKDFPREDRPPVWPVFVSFRLMAGLGGLFLAAALATVLFKGVIMRHRWLLWVYPLLIPLPYLTMQLGWAVTEVGRQPWVVYGLMRTALAGSPVGFYQVAGSLAVMGAVYTLLTVLGFFLMGRAAFGAPRLTD